MNRYQRQSGSTLMARLRDDLAEVLTSRLAKPGGVLTSEGVSLKACEAGVL
jgi:hypothetical protein